MKKPIEKSMGFFDIADRTGLEPATSAVTGRHSNQLNYRSVPFQPIQVVFGTAKIRGNAFLKQIFSKKNSILIFTYLIIQNASIP